MEDKLREEINKNIFAKGASLEAYQLLRKSINTCTHEFDEIRFEICRCIVTFNSQAAITLTNHLIEKFLRYRVIYNVSGTRMIENLTVFNKWNAAADRNIDKSLQQLINAAKKQGIISKDQQKQLDIYNKTIRVPYSHGMPSVFEKDEKIMMAHGSLYDNNHSPEVGEVNAIGLLPLHGMMQESLASQQVVPYFLYVDELIMSKCKCTPRWP